MRKVWLSILAVGVLAPSLASATTTYVYRYQATGGSVVPAVAASPTNNFGLLQFYLELATDASKKGKCAFSSTGTSSFTSANIGLIKKIVTEPGDTTFSDGTITTPAPGSSGPVVGHAWFAGFSSAAGLTNSAILDASDTASSAVICGGSASGSGVATCGNGTLCENADLTKGDAVTNCATNGGDFVDTTAPSGLNASNLVVFVYPLAGSLCTNQSETLAECCTDPNLVIITSNHSTVSDQKSGGPSTYSTVDAQGDGGFSEAYSQ